MERRVFIVTALSLFYTTLHAKKSSPTHWELLESIYLHLFPQTKTYQGATQIKMVNFLQLVAQDKYFDKDDLNFILQGVNEIYRLNNNFISSSKEKKERVLREYEMSEFGQNWLSTILYYGFEGMLSDPIYGGNFKQLGWKNISHNSGLPRPKLKYGKSNV